MIEPTDVPESIREHVVSTKRSNLGGGFSMPMKDEMRQFLRENKNTEMFRTVLEACEIYKKHVTGMLMRAREHDDIVRYQGQMQGVQAIQSLLKYAAEEES